MLRNLLQLQTTALPTTNHWPVTLPFSNKSIAPLDTRAWCYAPVA